MTRPSVLWPGDDVEFPDPGKARGEGLVAIGGDLSPRRLMAAYEKGIFPWYEEGVPPLWWSPDPRAIIEADALHVSRSLRRRLRSGTFTVTLDVDFRSVITACAAERVRGTWILPEMIEAYVRLAELGHAHSFEVWMNGELAGGLYGVHSGALFAAESMFHRRTDASKVALCYAVRALFSRGVTLFDVQFLTPHLGSLGARTIPRSEYLSRVAAAVRLPVALDGLGPRIDLEI